MSAEAGCRAGRQRMFGGDENRRACPKDTSMEQTADSGAKGRE